MVPMVPPSRGVRTLPEQVAAASTGHVPRPLVMGNVTLAMDGNGRRGPTVFAAAHGRRRTGDARQCGGRRVADGAIGRGSVTPLVHTGIDKKSEVQRDGAIVGCEGTNR